MDDALAGWLTLREPVDAAARSTTVTTAIAEAIAGSKQLHVLDLATGAGSNLRYLMERFGGTQDWLVVDRSTMLLATLLARTEAWARARGYRVETTTHSCRIIGDRLSCRVQARQMDLATLDGLDMFAGRDLVTASALLDLVSEPWLGTLATQCRSVGAAGLFSTIYDGRWSCTRIDPDDAVVLDLFNRHQRTDKGFGGKGKGPDATATATGCFVDAGYRVLSEPGDWTLGASAAELQRQLIEGWALAAVEVSPPSAPSIELWKRRRLGHVDSGRSWIMVGHHDIAAWHE